jgi:hypothetical protein
MKKALFLCATLCVVAARPSRADDYEDGKRFWDNGNYFMAYETLFVARAQPDGRRVELDYMLGTSACRIDNDDHRQWGSNFLAAMLDFYSLTGERRLLVLEELEYCKRELSRAETRHDQAAEAKGRGDLPPPRVPKPFPSASADPTVKNWPGKAPLPSASPGPGVRGNKTPVDQLIETAPHPSPRP